MLLWQRQGGTGKELESWSGSSSTSCRLCSIYGWSYYGVGCHNIPLLPWRSLTFLCKEQSFVTLLQLSIPQRASPGHSSAEHKEKLDCLALATSEIVTGTTNPVQPRISSFSCGYFYEIKCHDERNWTWQNCGFTSPHPHFNMPVVKSWDSTRGILLLIHRAFYIEIREELKDKNNMGIMKWIMTKPLVKFAIPEKLHVQNENACNLIIIHQDMYI